MKTKQMALIVIGLFCVSGLLFAGGQQDGSATAAKGATVAPAGQFPIVQDKVTVTAFLAAAPLVDDYQNNAFTEYLEKKTNVHLDLNVAPPNESTQKRNVLLASGDYPEVFINGGFSNAEQYLYGRQGVFLPMNDMIDKYGVGVKKAFEQFPLVKKNFTMPDGKVYSLPDVNDCFHCSMAQKMWIYKPWLDKLGLSMPTTTEQFKKVLEAFRDKDPNGNGKKDEIPLAGAVQGWYAGVDGFLMNAFIYTQGNLAEQSNAKRLQVVNGKVDAVFDDPAWKQGLLYLHSLYAEGLIAPDSFIQDQNQYMQMGENPGDVILGAGTGGHMGVFTNFQGESGRWLDYVTVPPLKGPNGVQITRYDPVFGAAEWTITDKAKNPAVAFRLGDAFYDDDVMLRDIYGIEGVDWRWAKDGEIGINGKPAIWVAIKGRGEIDKKTWWNQVGPQLRTRDFRLGRLMQGEKELEVILFRQTAKNYEPYRASDDRVLPPLSFDEADAAEVVEYQTTLDDYVNEMIARFTTGDADINKGWDGYLAELKKIGIDRYLQLLQKAYDAR